MAKLRFFLLLGIAAAIAACSAPQGHLPNAAYYMGETYLRRGQLDQAVEAYKVFITDPGPNPDLYLPRAYYMLAFAYYRQGRYEESMNTLDELEKRYPEMDSVQVWTLRGDTSKVLGNKVEAVQEYDEAWRFANQLDRVRLESRITSTLKEMNVEELSRVEPLVSDPAVHAQVARYLTEAGGSLIAADEQAALADRDAALAAGAASEGAILRTEERRRALELESQKRERLRAEEESASGQRHLEVAAAPPEPVMAQPSHGPGKVVCLAPLTGADSAAGQNVCNSVNSAFAEATDRIVAQDAGETSNAARAAWMTALEDPAVVAAIAYLPHDAAQAVAPMAEAAGVPMILLSGGTGNDGRYVREWGPGRSAEVNSLAKYMIDTVHVRRFGVFYPDTPAGNDYLDRFAAAVSANQGSVVGKQLYRTGNLDERPLLETLQKWRKRDVNVEAVFVPDQLTNVEELVAAINRDYPDLIVLGLTSWKSTPLQVQAFVAGGSDTAAFDAASALYGAIIGGGADTRGDVEERLRHLDTATTATTSPPSILRLNNGMAEPVGS